MTALPAATPAILRRHPALWVEWLRLANAWSRWRREGSRSALLALCAIGVAAVALILTSFSGHAAAAIETLARYWVLVGVMTAVYAFSAVNRRRRNLEESQALSWLIATPIAPSSLRLSHAIRTLLPLFLMFVAIVIFAVSALLMNDGIAASAGMVVAAAGGGMGIGGAVGWWAAGRGRLKEHTNTAASRYVPRPRVTGSLRPDAAALENWPVAQVFAWSRPENSRYVLVAALLAVQGGSSAIAGLSVVAMYFIASYLAALLSAMMTVSKLAATWLRSTPMTLGAFVLTLSRRALIHQLVGTVLATAFMYLLGTPLSMALDVAALWFGFVISISGVVLVDSYRGRSPAVKIALSVAAFAAMAALVQFRAGAKT